MVIMYSTHCPWCDMLESELRKSKIEYEINTDTEVMKSKGITHVPMLEVDGVLMGLAEAFRWVKEKA